MTPVFLYSIHGILAKGLEAVLATSSEFTFAGWTPDLSECEERIREIQRSSSLQVLVLIELTGEITVARLRAMCLDASVRLILWVPEISVEFASQVLNCGIRGIVRKSLTVEQHLDFFRQVMLGQLGIEKSLSDQLVNGCQIVLTPRERQITELVAGGWKNKEIAQELGITEGTVKVYMSRLFHKVGAKDRHVLALFGLRNMGPSAESPASGARATLAPYLFFPNATVA